MELSCLVADLSPKRLIGDLSVDITGLSCQSGSVVPGTLFFCVPGTRHDGHDYAAQAVAAGAVGLVCEHPLQLAVPQVVVASVRRVMGPIAARFYEDPSARLSVTGITGTNGKTTTAHLMAAVYGAADMPCAVLGTIANRIGGVDRAGSLTTPDALELQRLLHDMVVAGDTACAMEASSHALSQDRTSGIDFDAVVFTNLTRDHLDYHADLDDYFAAKSRLFLPDGGAQPEAAAVVNVGDEWGLRLAQSCVEVYGPRLFTYALEDDVIASSSASAPQLPDTRGARGERTVLTPDVVARDVRLRADGVEFLLDAPRLHCRERVSLALGGRFNAANATAAATAALALGLPFHAVRRGLASVAGVAGRFQSVRAGQPFAVLVDYAHTPDSLQNVLTAARGICRGRLIVVFGCGGDRDRGKRPLMGEIAATVADRVFVTSDNPRGEPPLSIIADISAGIPKERCQVVSQEPDRRAAIGLALREARPDDVVVIAGKGHETGQVVGEVRLPFDDAQVARELLAQTAEAQRGE